MSEIMIFLKKCITFYLATDDNGAPKVRPFGAVCEYEGKLYITTSKQKDVYKQMVANPKVQICGMLNGEWIRLTGVVKTDERHIARKKMLETNPDLRNMYSEDDNKMVVLYFEKGTATIESFTKEPRNYTL